MNTSNVQKLPLALGALVGLAIVFMIDPHRGETRRANLKKNCAGVGQKCRSTWTQTLMNWRKSAADSVSSFEAEIRANAPAYLQ